MSVITTVEVVNQTSVAQQVFTITTVGSGFASIHGSLQGLDVDDHPQYHTDGRGDARYYQKSETYTQSEIDAKIASVFYISEQRFQDFTDQTPTALDTPTVVKYGPAITSPNGIVSVTAAGVFTVLKGGPFMLKSNLRVARLGAGGISHVHLWIETSVDLITWVPANVSIRITVGDTSTDAHLFDSSPAFLPSGLYVRSMMARSSTGTNAGGLYSEAPSSALSALGVGADPSASLEWHTIAGYNYE